MKTKLRILVLTKRQYTTKDLIDDRFGRLHEIPFELSRMGHVVTGICLSYKNKKEGLFNDGKLCWQSINTGKLKFLGLLRFIIKAKKYSNSADLIWACSDSFYGIIGYALSRKYRIPLIFDLYDNFEYFLAAKLPIIKQLYRHAIRNSDAVTCVSRPLSSLVKSYGRRHGIFVLENAARKDLFKPLDQRTCRRDLGLPENCRLVGTAGALYKNRGIEELFAAFTGLKALHPELHLAVAGPQNVKIPRGPHIHNFGVLPLEKVPLFLNALDVAVICVKEDDFGRYCYPQKAREIIACDVPLVAADVGSLKEIFVHSPEWLYEPGNSASLERVIENRLRDRRTGYEEPPTWSDMAKVFDAVIKSVLKIN